MASNRFFVPTVQIQADRYAVNLGPRIGWKHYSIESFNAEGRADEIRHNWRTIHPFAEHMVAAETLGLVKALDFHEARMKAQKDQEIENLAQSIRYATRNSQGVTILPWFNIGFMEKMLWIEIARNTLTAVEADDKAAKAAEDEPLAAWEMELLGMTSSR